MVFLKIDWTPWNSPTLTLTLTTHPLIWSCTLHSLLISLLTSISAVGRKGGGKCSTTYMYLCIVYHVRSISMGLFLCCPVFVQYPSQLSRRVLFLCPYSWYTHPVEQRVFCCCCCFSPVPYGVSQCVGIVRVFLPYNSNRRTKQMREAQETIFHLLSGIYNIYILCV